MIVSAYWRPGSFFLVDATRIVAGPFPSRAKADAWCEARTTRTWQGFKAGWVVTFTP